MLDLCTLECERSRPCHDDEELAAGSSAGRALELDCAGAESVRATSLVGSGAPTPSAHRPRRDGQHLALALQTHGEFARKANPGPRYEALYVAAGMNAIRWTGEICSHRCCNRAIGRGCGAADGARWHAPRKRHDSHVELARPSRVGCLRPRMMRPRPRQEAPLARWKPGARRQAQFQAGSDAH
jgi:hypothetical protein